MKKHYVNSPCGCGKLVDVIPYEAEAGMPESERAEHADRDYKRWGMIWVVLRTDARASRQEPRKPVPCCSFQDGEFETEREALAACELQKRHTEKQVLQALAVLEGVASEAWALARVRLSDLFELREQIAGHVGRQTCEVALCFGEGAPVCLSDEREAWLCEQHLAVGVKA
jgi:hypothetical protein